MDYDSSFSSLTGFIGTGGSYTTIDVPGSFYTTVYGINDVGQIVGSYNNAPDAPDHGFLFSGGIYTTIDVPGAFATLVLGTNDAGQIVGAYRDIDDEPVTGFVSTVPLPATLPLFATGLGLMGWLARRRRNKLA